MVPLNAESASCGSAWEAGASLFERCNLEASWGWLEEIETIAGAAGREQVQELVAGQHDFPTLASSAPHPC